MMTTYMIQNDGRIIDYTTRLVDAKRSALKVDGSTITMMRGHYYAEGFHQYVLEYNNNKWVYVWKRN